MFFFSVSFPTFRRTAPMGEIQNSAKLFSEERQKIQQIQRRKKNGKS